MTSVRCPACDAPADAARRRLPCGLTVTTCGACGLVYAVDRPEAETLAAQYTAEYYNAWGWHGNEVVVDRMKQATFADWLDRLAAYRATGRLLDVGCATGSLLALALDRGWDASGVELSQYAAAAAAARVGADRVRCGRIEQQAFAAASFDAVTMCDLLEHVADPRAVAGEVARILAPGGAVLLSTPWVGSLSYRLMGDRWTHFKTEHLQYFSPASLAALWSAAGLELRWHGPARKVLTLDYIDHQFRTYPHRVLTPLAAVLRRLCGPLAHHSVRISAGDLLAVAVKPTDANPDRAGCPGPAHSAG